MATLDAPPPVNLAKSIFLCNIFTFFFSATKSCLLPFLTIYLKMLGLSATQTGLIMGAKTFVGLIFAPLWARCSVRCGRRKCMMMFSLFVMGVTYLSLTAVPSIDENAFTSHCPALDGSRISLPDLPGKQGSLQKPTSIKPPLNFSSTTAQGVTEKPDNMKTTESPDNVKTSASNLSSSTTTKVSIEPSTAGKQSVVTVNKDISKTSTVKPITSTKPVPTEKPEVKSRIPSTTSKKTSIVTSTASTATDREISDILEHLLRDVGFEDEDLADLSESEMIQLVTELMEEDEGRSHLTEAVKNLSDDEYEKLDTILNSGSAKRRKRDSEVNNSSSSSTTLKTVQDKDPGTIWSTTNAFILKFKEIRDQIKNTENQMFLVVMIILMIGEALSCPIEKLADDGWYEFLESIDDIEKYGMHRIWSSFAYIVFPLIVTVSVDNTLCLFGFRQHPFMLHFYLFGGFLLLTFLLAFCYPMATSDKYRYATKVMKGLAVVGCNFRNLMMTITLLVMGTIFATYQNFLFWVLLDMGSKEVTLGLCLMMAALSEIPMLLFNEKLVKKIGNGGVICISVLFLSARCLYYSFLPSPWAVLPAEIAHAFTHTAMWGALLGTPAFNTSPALSRSIRSILSSVYFGIGYGLGSIISGAVYDIYGSAIMFQAGAVLAIGWFPLLCLSMRCCRERDRTDVKYQRLLTADDASDDSDDYEDDWLEKALKDK